LYCVKYIPVSCLTLSESRVAGWIEQRIDSFFLFMRTHDYVTVENL